MSKLDWTDLDQRSVDTVRVLAMDAVQKVGNGHPGTAMSLAPAAYVLFQKAMRHNPANPDWVGRDRFVLSCGHSSLTLYIQLYLGGWGLELDDLKSLRTWGSKTPGHPEYGYTAGVETTTGPLGQGVGNAVGMAMAARRERGLFDPDAAPGESPFDHQIYAFCSDGDLEEGVSSEASSLAGHQQLGNLTLIYDNNKISIEDDTSVAFSEDVSARYRAYGWHVQDVDWTHGGTGYQEDPQALWEAIEKARRVTDKPSFINLHTIIAWPAPTAQNTGAAHGSALGADEVAATKGVLGFDENQTFEVTPEVIEHTRSLVERGRQAEAEWQEGFDAWSKRFRQRRELFDRMRSRTLPAGWEESLPSFPADEKGVATRKASGEVLSAISPVLPELWGGSADLAGSNNTTPKGEPSFLPEEHSSKEFSGNIYGRVLHFGIREHGMGCGDERHRRARRHQGVRRHVPHVLGLHAPVGPPGGAHGAARDVRVDPRLHRARRGRPDPPARGAPRRPAGDPAPRRRPPRGRQRDRGGVADGAGAHRPTGRAHPVAAEPPDVPPRRRRQRPAVGRDRRCRQGRATCCWTPRAAHPT